MKLVIPEVYIDPKRLNHVCKRLTQWLQGTPTGRKILFLSQLPVFSFADEVLSWAWEFGISYDPPLNSRMTEEGWILQKIKWHLLDRYNVRLRNRFFDTTTFYQSNVLCTRLLNHEERTITPVAEGTDFEMVDLRLDMKTELKPIEWDFLNHRLDGQTIKVAAALVNRSEWWGNRLQAKIKALDEKTRKE